MRAMRTVTVNGVRIDDTFAEAFPMRATALVITADSPQWARQAADTMTGFATSVIGCGCEAGIDRVLSPWKTPDGRPGCRVLLFAVSTDRKSTRLNSSHLGISYAVFCLKKKTYRMSDVEYIDT